MRLAMVRMIQHDLHAVSDLSNSDTHLIELACSQLSHHIGQPGAKAPSSVMPVEQFSLIQELINDVRSQSRRKREHTSCIISGFQPSLPSNLQAKWTAFPLFDRLGADADVEVLAGGSRLPPIVRPIQMTLVPDRVNNFLEISHALRHCDHLCQLVSSQTNHIKNTHFLRVSLIQHLFTQVIPIPLPHNHPKKQDCPYSKEISYHLQLDIIRSLHVVARHFTACTMSVKVTRELDATRILTMACLCAITDAVIRISASDIPSQFCVHLAGNAPGPSYPFGFDIGNFAVQSELMNFFNPIQQTARAQVLEYFTEQRRTLRDNHVIFSFETSSDCGNVSKLLMQLIWEMGFDENKELGCYLSGEAPDILDFYPEFLCYRDIVFYFKLMMTPNVESLPPVKPWSQAHSKLYWSFKPDSGFVVKGFGNRVLKCSSGPLQADEGEAVSLWERFVSLFKKQTRAPPSGADPSVVAGAPITHEEDVLHIPRLPTFGDKISQRHCELLVSYLTAPYLRVPLILSFFAQQDRIGALACPQLQAVIDCALFEPGYWLPKDSFIETMTVPVKNRREHLATPCGLLFNELQHSPEGVLQCLTDLLDISLDLETNSYSESTSPVVLYVIRLLVRVEEFIIFLIRHNEWLSRDDDVRQCSGGWASYTRGLETVPRVLRLLTSARTSMRKLLDTRVFSMLERWCTYATKSNDLVLACKLHAHLGFLYKNVSEQELDLRTVSVLLSSQIFLTTRYEFVCDATAEEERKKAKTSAENAEEQALGFVDSEVFDLFQKHKYKVYMWLQQNSDAANEVFEAVVRIATFTGPLSRPTNTPPTRVWKDLPYRNCSGRFVPSTCITDDPDPPVADENETYESWIRRAQEAQQRVLDTEINVQLGDFTIKTARLELLSKEISSKIDFVSVFGESKDAIQCAEVKNTQFRTWVRLVGRRHDCLLWSADTRTPTLPSVYSRKYSKGNLYSSEKWIAEALEPCLAHHIRLREMKLYMPSKKYGADATTANLAGLHTPRQPKPDPNNAVSQPPPIPPTLKEICVFRKSRVVHVYNVIEHGRRLYRTLVFSSNPRYCFHNLESKLVVSQETSGGNIAPSYEAGNPVCFYKPSPSLVITRTLTSATGGQSTQTFVPGRHLHGLLPAVLVQQYQFWQNENKSLVGYERKGVETGVTQYSSAVSSTLNVAIVDGQAHLSRIPSSASAGDALTLLNLLYIPEGSMLRSLADLLLRLDNLSHCLVWSNSKVSETGSDCSIDVIEFPRLRLKFQAQSHPEDVPGSADHAQIRLYSCDHVGLFISNHRCAQTEKILSGLPNSILLEDIEGGLYVMVAASWKPSRPDLQSELFPPELIFDHRNSDWLASLNVRHYLYPIHLSRSFLFPTTFASALYLFALRFLNRQYVQAHQLADLCVTDNPLSAEERQIVQAIQNMRNDYHPDAHATRLKVALVTLDSSVECSWDLAGEFKAYLSKLDYVSCACRLSFEEEEACFKAIGEKTEASYALANRRNYLQALRSKSTFIKVALPHRVELTDTIIDKSWMTTSSFSSAFITTTYTRPEEVAGIEAMKLLNKYMERGFDLQGSANSLGFLFFYELMTNSLDFRVMPRDSTHTLACLLLRLLPSKDTQQKSLFFSILQLLANNRTLARDPSIPHFKDDKLRFATMAKIGWNGFSRLLKDLQKFLQGKDQQSFRYPKQYARPRAASQEQLSDMTSMSRQWVCPKIVDYSCDDRVLCSLKELQAGESLLGINERDIKAFSSFPMSILGLNSFIAMRNRTDRNLPTISRDVPFNISHHQCAKSHVAKSMMTRMKEDAKTFAETENEGSVPKLCGFFDVQVESYMASPDGPGLGKAIEHVEKLFKMLHLLKVKDSTFVNSNICETLRIANSTGDKHSLRARSTFLAARDSGHEPEIWFDYLVASLMSTKAEASLQKLNPFLSPSSVRHVLNLTVSVMMHVIRIGQTQSCIATTRRLLNLLKALRSMNAEQAEANPAIRHGIVLEAGQLAQNLACKRHFIKREGEKEDPTLNYDPRFLVSEFTYNLMLRQSQVCYLVHPTLVPVMR